VVIVNKVFSEQYKLKKPIVFLALLQIAYPQTISTFHYII